MSNLLLNLDDFVRVTQFTGSDIEGRYDGTDYVFPDGEAVDVHKAVAVHIFGFGLPEESTDARVQDKTAALLRLGWIQSSGDKQSGLDALRTKIRFEEIPPFPTLLRLKPHEEDSGLAQVDSAETESASRVPSSPPLGGGAGLSAASPSDPTRRTLHLPGKAAQ